MCDRLSGSAARRKKSAKLSPATRVKLPARNNRWSDEMARFVRLTDRGTGRPVWINPDHVVKIKDLPAAGGTELSCLAGDVVNIAVVQGEASEIAAALSSS